MVLAFSMDQIMEEENGCNRRKRHFGQYRGVATELTLV